VPWLTWQQAGDKFGLSPDAVRMRARRLGWRTQPGNAGRTLVEVPEDAEVKPRERTSERAPEASAEHETMFARLTELLTVADARAERADLRADRAEQRAEQAEQRADAANTDRRAAEAREEAERARADRAEQAAASERTRTEALRDRLDTIELAKREAEEATGRAQHEATEARHAAEELRQADQARKARGRLRRVLAAWRGE
jgi:hypothetical protein